LNGSKTIDACYAFQMTRCLFHWHWVV